MKDMETIIHEDDWRKTGWMKWAYSENEIKVMMRKYAEGIVRELWEYMPSHEDENINREVSRLFIDTLQEIQKQVII